MTGTLGCVHPAVALELALLTPQVRRDRTQLEALLHPEFREVGASGRLWHRDAMIAALQADDAAAAVEAVDVDVQEPVTGVALVTYRSDPGGRAAHRSSVWVAVGGRWQLLHHQGTLAAGG